MKFRKFIMFLGIGSLVALPVTMASCGTTTLGEKGSSSDWGRGAGEIKGTDISYKSGTAQTAIYSVKIVETWDGVISHPSAPGYNGHFENIIWDLKNNQPFWKINEKASSNFANFTTKGAMSGFSNKVTGKLSFLYKYTFNITVDQRNPYFTLATRFAPSPDWFGGISNLNLFNTEWADKAFYYMKVYSSAVKDERFTDTGKIIKNTQMNNDKDSSTFKPFGFITVTKK